MELLTQLFNNFLAIINTFQFKDAVDILAIAFIIYNVFKFVQETRAEQLLKGILLLLLIYIASLIFNLTMMTWLIKIILEFGVILLAIVFQPEIRNALEQMGRSKISKARFALINQRKHSDEWISRERKAIIDVADAAQVFSVSKTGALIVFEKETKLSDIAQTGTVLNSETSVALFGNVFFNKAPLHDGACIVRDGLLYAAGCILPLASNNKDININLGTRHRAAIGMSENSDAVVVVVSEETGFISVAIKGVLNVNITKSQLIEILEKNLIPKEEEKRTDLFSIFSSRRKEDNSDEK